MLKNKLSLPLRSIHAAMLTVGLTVGASAQEPPPKPHGIYERPGALIMPRPEALANPLITGVVLEAEWANVESSPGEYDWAYFDAALAVLGIADRSAALSLGGARPDWLGGQPNPDGKGDEKWDEKWSEMVSEFANHFARHPGVSMIAIAAEGLPGAVWELSGDGELASGQSNPPPDLESAAQHFAQAFPEKSLGLYLRLPSGENGAGLVGRAIEQAKQAAGERLVVIPWEIHGEKDSLAQLQPAGKAIRSLHDNLATGIRLATHIGRAAAQQESSDGQSAGAGAKPAESPAEQLRRSMQFGLWIGARHFEVQSVDAGNYAARSDFSYLHTRLLLNRQIRQARQLQNGSTAPPAGPGPVPIPLPGPEKP